MNRLPIPIDRDQEPATASWPATTSAEPGPLPETEAASAPNAHPEPTAQPITEDQSPAVTAEAPTPAAMHDTSTRPAAETVAQPTSGDAATSPEADASVTPSQPDASPAEQPDPADAGTVSENIAPIVRPEPDGAPPERRSIRAGDRTAPRAPSKFAVFAEGDHVVYPTHGAGKVVKVGTEEIAGHQLELIHITFQENQMTLRVPILKARSAGL